MGNVGDSLTWLYDGNIVHTPSTAGVSVSQLDDDYKLTDDETSQLSQANTKREFKQWLASTGYEGRWRSTNDYQGLSQHDQTTFRSQAKAIFSHILKLQLSPNDADMVWEELIDEEMNKSISMRDG